MAKWILIGGSQPVSLEGDSISQEGEYVKVLKTDSEGDDEVVALIRLGPGHSIYKAPER
jgi:hypothetical protein